GWQTGASNSWTGYGVIHQGQKVRNTIVISGAQLSGVGSLPVITVLLAKYNDPRSATPGQLHRLPSTPPDVLGGFAYRMPHGAFDSIQGTYAGASDGWLSNVQSTNTLRFRVVDWDARATATTLPNLADDPDATHVLANETGFPELAICVPDILGDRTTITVLAGAPIDDDSAYGGDASRDSGGQGDPLFFANAVEKPAGTDQEDGLYQGWLRLTDPEVDSQSDYLVALNPDLTPITGAFPVPITYHPFMVRVGGPCAPPQGVGWATDFGNPDSVDINLYGIAVDSANNSYTIGSFSSQIDLGGGEIPSNGQDDVFLVKHDANGDYVWGKTFGGARTESGRAVAVDSQDRIWVGIAHAGPTDLGGGLLTPGGSYGMLVGRFDSNGVHQFSDSFGVAGFNYLQSLTIGPGDAVYLAGYSDDEIDFGDGPLNSAGMEDIVAAVLEPTGVGRWGQIFGSTEADRGLHVVADATGAAYVGGSFSGTVDFGPASPVSAGGTDAFLLKLAAADGAPVWVDAFGNTGADRTQRVGIDSAGSHVYAAGLFESSIDLGGGPRPGQGTDDAVFLGQFTLAGAHVWSHSFFDVSADLALLDLAVDAGGNVVIGGSFFDSVTFGGFDRFGNGSAAGYLASFSPAGMLLADGQIGGDGGDQVRALRFLPFGQLLYGGYADGRVDLNPDCNVNEFLMDSDGDFFVARTSSGLGW
ncbi:MAG: hypothetical protein ABI743_09205, partial [bacterium]